MLGLASKGKPAVRACPTLSHVLAARGTAKVRADWAFVSGVSAVSPYLGLIDDYRNGDWGKAAKGINRPLAPFARTGGTSATATRFQGETLGARHR
jgi:hypothetical protein